MSLFIRVATYSKDACLEWKFLSKLSQITELDKSKQTLVWQKWHTCQECLCPKSSELIGILLYLCHYSDKRSYSK